MRNSSAMQQQRDQKVKDLEKRKRFLHRAKGREWAISQLT